MNKEISPELAKQLPKPYHKRRFYNLSEVQVHNTANDLWVTFFGEVYDLTKLVQENRISAQVEPIIQAAGTDITHWFDSKTKEPHKYINQQGKSQFYLPMGKFLHLNYQKDHMMIPWWKNQQYLIGKITKKSQKIRIINTLSNTEDLLQVPRQQKINQILNRYEQINCHAKSYTWKRKNTPLNMELNLEENGIIDQDSLYEDLQIPEQMRYVPAIHIHFNDDLTSK